MDGVLEQGHLEREGVSVAYINCMNNQYCSTRLIIVVVVVGRLSIYS